MLLSGENIQCGVKMISRSSLRIEVTSSPPLSRTGLGLFLKPQFTGHIGTNHFVRLRSSSRPQALFQQTTSSTCLPRHPPPLQPLHLSRSHDPWPAPSPPRCAPIPHTANHAPPPSHHPHGRPPPARPQLTMAALCAAEPRNPP